LVDREDGSLKNRNWRKRFWIIQPRLKLQNWRGYIIYKKIDRPENA
jgi:hypothetical protein